MERFTQHTPNGASLILGEPKTQAEAAAVLKEQFKKACNYLCELEDKLEAGQLVDTTPYIEEVKSEIPFKYKVIKPTVHRRNVEMCQTKELAEKVIAKFTDAEAFIKEEDGDIQKALAFAERVIKLCKEHEKEYSHLCNSKKECHDETVRYIAVLRLRQQIEGLIYEEQMKTEEQTNPCVACDTVEVRCKECAIPKPSTHGSNARPPEKIIKLEIHTDKLQERIRKDTLEEVFNDMYKLVTKEEKHCDVTVSGADIKSIAKRYGVEVGEN